MDRIFQEIAEFRAKWAHEPGMGDVAEPIDPYSPEGRKLISDYIAYIRSELVEIEDDLEAGLGMPAVIDGISDSLVFHGHWIHRLGLASTFGVFFSEVNRSNLTKGQVGRLIDPETGKMIKGPGYEKPRIPEIYNELFPEAANQPV